MRQGQGLSADQYINKVKDTVPCVFHTESIPLKVWDRFHCDHISKSLRMDVDSFLLFCFCPDHLKSLYLNKNLLRYCFWLFFFFMIFLGGLRDLSSLSRDWTCTPCPGRWSLNHWTARKIPQMDSFDSCQTAVTLHGRVCVPALQSHWCPQKELLVPVTAWGWEIPWQSPKDPCTHL